MTVFRVEEFDTPHQLMALFRDASGMTYYVKPFEKPLSIKVDGTDVSLLVEYFDIKERSRSWSIVGHGKRLVTWRHGRKIAQLDIPDEDFTPYEVEHFGTHRSVAETVDRIWWERDCYRPGTGSAPQDNYYRQQEGYHPTERVKTDNRLVVF